MCAAGPGQAAEYEVAVSVDFATLMAGGASARPASAPGSCGDVAHTRSHSASASRKKNGTIRSIHH
jgi:hypothetical protein